MKVILKQTVPKVGKEGQVVNVADGYARNYLFARGLAIVADKKQLSALEKRNERIAAKLAGTKSDAEATGEQLNGTSIRISAKVGKDTGKLFGAVTAQDIADVIQKEAGVALEKKQVALHEPIKRLGNYQIEIDLHREVSAFVNLEIFDPEAPVAVAAPVATEPVSTENINIDEEETHEEGETVEA